jgi:hypothetical protein
MITPVTFRRLRTIVTQAKLGTGAPEACMNLGFRRVRRAFDFRHHGRCPSAPAIDTRALAATINIEASLFERRFLAFLSVGRRLAMHSSHSFLVPPFPSRAIAIDPW